MLYALNSTAYKRNKLQRQKVVILTEGSYIFMVLIFLLILKLIFIYKI